MAVTAAQVKAFAPEFAGVLDARIDTYLGFAPGYVARAVYGNDTDQAVLLWTCHSLTRTTGGNAAMAGAVTLDKAGDVQTESTGVQGWMAENQWGTTAYGQQLIMLSRRYTAGGFIV